MNVLDLFSGIGGFSLGLERAGMRTVALGEIEPFQRSILAKHWPEVPCYDDVRALSASRLSADGVAAIDVICGGFPCQDLSTAGRQAGIAGEKSGLWSELHRLIGELRPRFAIVENVPNLLVGERGSWFSRVLGDLAEIGYDAVWHCIPASTFGAPHTRDRVWIISYPDTAKNHSGAINAVLADHAYAGRNRETGWRTPMPEVSRMGDGIPGELDRLGSLGNSVVPIIPEIIGRAIMSTALSSQEGKTS